MQNCNKKRYKKKSKNKNSVIFISVTKWLSIEYLFLHRDQNLATIEIRYSENNITQVHLAPVFYDVQKKLYNKDSAFF